MGAENCMVNLPVPGGRRIPSSCAMPEAAGSMMKTALQDAYFPVGGGRHGPIPDPIMTDRRGHGKCGAVVLESPGLARSGHFGL